VRADRQAQSAEPSPLVSIWLRVFELADEVVRRRSAAKSQALKARLVEIDCSGAECAAAHGPPEAESRGRQAD
jgi:hypothetical protein